VPVNASIRQNDSDIVRSLLEVGVNLAADHDCHHALDMILKEARRLSRAQAGTLYILKDGIIHFGVVQNDRMDVTETARTLASRSVPLAKDTLIGYVASTGETVNIPNVQQGSSGLPFHVVFDFDEKNYRTESILAVPLTFCGPCVGILQLMNCQGDGGRVSPFKAPETSGIASLASMAGVTIHNMLFLDHLKATQLETLIRLSVVAEFRSGNLLSHIRRVSRTSAVLAETIGLAPNEVELIRSSSPMHDIGMISVPDSILSKIGQLSLQERGIMQNHTIVGAQILGEPSNELIAMAREVSMSHHERWDGEGYPKGLSGEKIPMCGRIVALADVLDALLSRRPFDAAFSLSKWLEIIKAEDGRHFDPQLVAAFSRSADKILEPYMTSGGL